METEWLIFDIPWQVHDKNYLLLRWAVRVLLQSSRFVHNWKSAAMAFERIHLVFLGLAICFLSGSVSGHEKKLKKITSCRCSMDEGEIDLRKLAGKEGKPRYRHIILQYVGAYWHEYARAYKGRSINRWHAPTKNKYFLNQKRKFGNYWLKVRRCPPISSISRFKSTSCHGPRGDKSLESILSPFGLFLDLDKEKKVTRTTQLFD